jgi:hypothetical protein
MPIYQINPHQNVTGDYPSSSTCNYLVTAGSGKVVSLTFTNFTVEYLMNTDCTSDFNCSNCSYDYVALYDGTSEVILTP